MAPICSRRLAQLLLSDAEKDFIRHGIVSLDCRIDGRRRQDVRRYAVRTGVYPMSYGSAEILQCCSASVQAELVEYSPSIVVEFQQERITFMEDYLLSYLKEHLTIPSSTSTTNTTGWLYWKLSIDVVRAGMDIFSGATTTVPTSLEAIAQCIRFALLDTRLPALAIVDKNTNEDHTTDHKKLLDRITLVPDETIPLINDFALTLISVYEISGIFFLDADEAERLVSTVTHVVVDQHSTVWHCQGNPSAVPVAVGARTMIDQHYQIDESRVVLVQ